MNCANTSMVASITMSAFLIQYMAVRYSLFSYELDNMYCILQPNYTKSGLHTLYTYKLYIYNACMTIICKYFELVVNTCCRNTSNMQLNLLVAPSLLVSRAM